MLSCVAGGTGGGNGASDADLAADKASDALKDVLNGNPSDGAVAMGAALQAEFTPRELTILAAVDWFAHDADDLRANPLAMEALLVIYGQKVGDNAEAKVYAEAKGDGLSCEEADEACDQSVFDAADRVGDDVREKIAECMLTDRSAECIGGIINAGWSAFFETMDFNAYLKSEALMSSVSQWAAECGSSGDVCADLEATKAAFGCGWYTQSCEDFFTQYPQCESEVESWTSCLASLSSCDDETCRDEQERANECADLYCRHPSPPHRRNRTFEATEVPPDKLPPPTSVASRCRLRCLTPVAASLRTVQSTQNALCSVATRATVIAFVQKSAAAPADERQKYPQINYLPHFCRVTGAVTTLHGRPLPRTHDFRRWHRRNSGSRPQTPRSGKTRTPFAQGGPEGGGRSHDKPLVQTQSAPVGCRRRTSATKAPCGPPPQDTRCRVAACAKKSPRSP